MKIIIGIFLMGLLASPAFAQAPATHGTPLAARAHAMKPASKRHRSSKVKSTVVNGPTGAGKAGTGGPGAGAGTNSNGMNGPTGPVTGSR
jgi:hypothetical protein